MGLTAIDFKDIACWQEIQGFVLSPWECSVIRQMSLEFVAQAKKAEKVDCPSPWLHDLPPKSEIAEAMLTGLRNLNGRSQPRNKSRV